MTKAVEWDSLLRRAEGREVAEDPARTGGEHRTALSATPARRHRAPQGVNELLSRVVAEADGTSNILPLSSRSYDRASSAP